METKFKSEVKPVANKAPIANKFLYATTFWKYMKILESRHQELKLGLEDLKNRIDALQKDFDNQV